MRRRGGATTATHFLVFETSAPGTEKQVYDTTDRKLADHIAMKGNKMRRTGNPYPAYDVRVVVPA